MTGRNEPLKDRARLVLERIKQEGVGKPIDRRLLKSLEALYEETKGCHDHCVAHSIVTLMDAKTVIQDAKEVMAHWFREMHESEHKMAVHRG